jgi:outer membrane protein assembly factor BamD
MHAKAQVMTWRLLALVLVMVLVTSCSFRRKKYENPITKDTQQPDKVLYDKAIKDIEKSRFEIARLTLNTLINTYDTSEFLAKAKLAIADSWFREGGSHGLAQAEAEYKDFILFYPTLEEAAESQEKICMIHYRQMEKADRDSMHALRAEQECKQLLVQFPNSKFAPRVEQLLRNIQEVLAMGEFKTGTFYHNKGSNSAAGNRLTNLVNHYPLFSQADEALWLAADSYGKMDKRFRPQAGEALQRIVKDYPLSAYAESAKKRLKEWEMEVPEADPVAVSRMKYEQENRTRPGMLSRATGFIRTHPNTSAAAKSGQPAMEGMRPSIPVTVPVAGDAGFSGDVTVGTVGDSTALDTKPDARANPPGAKPAGSEAPQQEPQTSDPKNQKKKKDNKKKS